MFIQHYDERIKVIKSSFKKVKNSKNLDKCNDEAQKILNEIITETDDFKSKLKLSFL
jgi:thymidylate kinase